MNTLPLALSPRETSDESNEFRRIESEGFIDEQVVSRIIARGTYDRTIIQPAGVALSANADDYAGWMLPVRSPSQGMAEHGIETPYQGGHR